MCPEGALSLGTVVSVGRGPGGGVGPHYSMVQEEDALESSRKQPIARGPEVTQKLARSRTSSSVSRMPSSSQPHLPRQVCVCLRPGACGPSRSDGADVMVPAGEALPACS